ncbi:MAG: efflux RND transporter periplasmic adaptor subunit [Pseudomonadales bacterium]
MGETAQNSSELLGKLAIDRDASPSDQGRPVKWFVLIAILAGIGFIAWLLPWPGALAEVSVRTALARAPSLASSGSSVLDATGYVVARRQATVSSKATGKVVEVLIEEGMRVVDGQLLARLDDSIPRAQLDLANSQIASARASLDELDVQLRQTKLDLQRTQGLAVRNLASQADLDRDQLSVEALIARLERARKDVGVAQGVAAVQQQQLTDMEIRAPFAGVVIAKAAQPGEMISPVSAGGGFTRTGICTIVDMDSLEVEVDVNESYINRVTAGQHVDVVLNAYPADRYPAQVIAIIPAADRSKATVRVRVGFVEKDQRVLPDMGVQVAFLGDEPPNAPTPEGVTVPASAVGERDGRQIVYVVEAGSARPVTVVGDAPQGGRAKIHKGLLDGQRVVVELNEDLIARLGDGTAVKAEG